jgi:hypothetical protein
LGKLNLKCEFLKMGDKKIFSLDVVWTFSKLDEGFENW